jgi:branched-chain amino acid transport system substrate-binding protein
VRQIRKVSALAIAVAAMGAVAAGCGSSSSSSSGGSSSSPIKIGVLLEMTGPGSDYGTKSKDSIEMLLDEYGHKVAGHPIEVVYADDGTDPSKAVAKARQLIQKDKVQATFGPVFSDAQDAIAPYLGSQKVLAMAPIGADWTLAKYKNWIVFPGTLDSFCTNGGKALYAQGKRTMTTLAADYVAGHQIVDPLAKEFQDAGGKVVQKQYAPLGTSDFGSYISALKPADVFGAWTIIPDELAMIKSFLDFKKSSKTEMFLCEAENVNNQQLKDLGSGVLGTKGMIAAYSPDLPNAANQKFVANFKKRYNRVPTIAEGTAYVTFGSLLEGLKKTNGDASLDKIRPAIIGSTRDTVSGKVGWSKNGFALSNRYLATVTDEGGNYIWKPSQTFTDVRDPRDTP